MIEKLKYRLKNNEGFTLIELMVTILILGILSTGLISMLSDAKKVQVMTKEVDMVNMKTSSVIEKLRYSPEEAITEFKGLGLTQKGKTDIEKKYNKKKVITKWLESKAYEAVVYYNKSLEETDKSKAYYKMNISINGEDDKTGEMSFIPDMQNRRYGSFNLYPNIKNYVLWVKSSLSDAEDQQRRRYVSHNYEMLVLNNQSESTFEDYVVRWGLTRHYTTPTRINAWSREKSLGEMNNHIFREMISAATERSPRVPTQYDIDRQLNAVENVRGSIPVSFEYDELPQGGGQYNIYVYNECLDALDFYLKGDESNSVVNIVINEGIGNVTYLKPDRHIKTKYEFKISVERVEDGTVLTDYKSGC